MGTNLSQVFISAALTALSGSTFNSSGAAADDVGIWNLGTNAYQATALYDAVIESGAAADNTDTLTLANPLWLVNDFQVVQRAVSGNWIASPMISAKNVRRIKYDDYTATVQMKHVLSGAFDANDEYVLKFVVKTSPVDYLNFSEPANSMVDLSGDSKVFPLGLTSATNHKVVNIHLASANGTLATDLASLKTAIEGSILKDVLKVGTSSTANDQYTVRHAGVVVDLIVYNVTDAEVESGVTVTTTAFNPGVGNDWQVFAEEKRCRARNGNFNRMYFPASVDTYTRTGGAYDKIVIEYEHEWPNATGIAPAGALNQAVIYLTNAGTDPGTTANEFDDLFGYTAGTSKEFKW